MLHCNVFFLVLRLQGDWLASVSNDTTVHVQDVDHNISRLVRTHRGSCTHHAMFLAHILNSHTESKSYSVVP